MLPHIIFKVISMVYLRGGDEIENLLHPSPPKISQTPSTFLNPTENFSTALKHLNPPPPPHKNYKSSQKYLNPPENYSTIFENFSTHPENNSTPLRKISTIPKKSQPLP